MLLVASNVGVGLGEIDLLMVDGGDRVAVEVRTTRADGDPIDAVPVSKRRRVSALARRVGARRVDVVGVGLHEHGITIHWVPGEN